MKERGIAGGETLGWIAGPRICFPPHAARCMQEGEKM